MLRPRPFAALATLVVLFNSQPPVRAAIIHESAGLGPTGQQTGTFIATGQFLGSRFTVAEAVEVTAVGGHIAGFRAGDIGPNAGPIEPIFAAIVPLGAPGGLPPDTPATFTPLAVTTFTPPEFSADVRVPLSVTLAPGHYGLVFGSGRFGATGTAVMTRDNVPLPEASRFGGGGVWRNGGNTGLRFVVEGEVVTAAVPEPASAVLAGLGVVGMAARLRRRAG